MFVDEVEHARIERGSEWIEVQAVEFGVLEEAQTVRLGRMRAKFGDEFFTDGLKAGANRATRRNGTTDPERAPDPATVAAASDPWVTYDAVTVCVAGIVKWSADRVVDERNIRKLPEAWLRPCLARIVDLSTIGEEEGKDSPAPLRSP